MTVDIKDILFQGVWILDFTSADWISCGKQFKDKFFIVSVDSSWKRWTLTQPFSYNYKYIKHDADLMIQGQLKMQNMNMWF